MDFCGRDAIRSHLDSRLSVGKGGGPTDRAVGASGRSRLHPLARRGTHARPFGGRVHRTWAQQHQEENNDKEKVNKKAKGEKGGVGVGRPAK